MCKNYAVANVTDERIVKGRSYPILSVKGRFVTIMVQGVPTGVNICDNDFTFHINEKDSATDDTTKNWLHSSPEDVKNMSVEEAMKIIERSIVLDHSKGDFKLPARMTKAMEILLQIAKIHYSTSGNDLLE